MDIQTFISKYRQAFGETAELPLLFYYDNEPVADTEKINGCFFKGMDAARKGEGILFFATPDMLSGLATWAFFDNNADDAVSCIFGSGCSSVVAQAVKENRNAANSVIQSRPHSHSQTPEEVQQGELRKALVNQALYKNASAGLRQIRAKIAVSWQNTGSPTEHQNTYI